MKETISRAEVNKADRELENITKVKTSKREKLLDALNRLDEFACMATEDNDNGEAQEQEKDYDLLFNFINSYADKITIPFSDSDLEDLLAGEEFSWTFDGIDVLLRKETEEDLQ